MTNYFYQKLYLFNEKDKLKAIFNSSISNDEHLKLQDFNRNVIGKLQKELKFTYIQLDKEFCDDEKCYLGTEVKSKYRDDNHISISGALSLHNSLNSYIKTKQ